MEATQILEKGMTLQCRVAFTFAGKEFKPGDIFNYTELNAKWDRVRMLFDQRKVVLVPIQSMVTQEKSVLEEDTTEEVLRKRKPVKEEPVVEEPRRRRRG